MLASPLLTSSLCSALKQMFGKCSLESTERLRVGSEVRLSIIGPCPRCVMMTWPQADLPPDPGILGAAAKHKKANVGVYATVLEGGTIRRGDVARLE